MTSGLEVRDEGATIRLVGPGGAARRERVEAACSTRIVSMPSVLARLPDSIDARVRGVAWASLVVQIGIVATGGAVRLTGSGLGCPTWPRCTPDTFIVMPEQGIHGAIEFGNRMLTFVLTAVALLAVLYVAKLRRSRPDLWHASLILAAGIPAQAALGGLTVLTGLNPWLVGAHFLLSAALVSVATLFVLRTRGGADGPDRVPASLARTAYAVAYAVAIAATITLLLGVVVTGAGPHAGDAATPRNGLDVAPLQHLHSYPAYAMLALTLVLVALVRRREQGRERGQEQGRGLERVRALAYGLLVLELGQIALGITQARLGVPALLVGMHMVLACLVVATLTALVSRLRAAREGSRPLVAGYS